MKTIIITFSLLLGISTLAFSQNGKEERKQLRAGNKDYKKERYTESEIIYRKALEANARSADAAYNLGNSLYKQSKLPEAGEQYQAMIKDEKDKEKLAMAWHNTGNIFMSGKDYAKSVEAYKQSLRNNPNDEETRYNLALAQKLLSDQQQQNQDQDKDQKDKDKEKEKEKEKEQQKQDQNKDQEQKEQQQNQNQMSKQNAQQILDAMMQNEKNTQEKVKEQQARQQQQRKTEKNW